MLNISLFWRRLDYFGEILEIFLSTNQKRDDVIFLKRDSVTRFWTLIFCIAHLGLLFISIICWSIFTYCFYFKKIFTSVKISTVSVMHRGVRLRGVIDAISSYSLGLVCTTVQKRNLDRLCYKELFRPSYPSVWSVLQGVIQAELPECPVCVTRSYSEVLPMVQLYVTSNCIQSCVTCGIAVKAVLCGIN